MNVDYELDNGIISTVNYLWLITVLCDVSKCPILREHTEIYAKVLRMKYMVSPTYSQMVGKTIWIMYVHTYIHIILCV